MKFYPRLKIWKNSSGTCTFDGVFAYSYNWYCMVIVLPDGRNIVNRYSYSNTTTQHLGGVRGLIDRENVVYVKAPRGLTNTEATRQALEEEIVEINAKLKRARKKERYISRLAEIEVELKLNVEIEEFLQGKKAEQLKAA